jgi:hypothetical protein
MRHTPWLGIASYVIIPLGTLIIFALLFTPSMRSASWWLRVGFALEIPLAFAWSVLSLYLRQHVHAPDAASPTMWDLAQHKSFIAGLAVGSLLVLLFSPEMRQLSRRRRNTSNQSLQPTASRRTTSFSDD